MWNWELLMQYILYITIDNQTCGSWWRPLIVRIVNSVCLFISVLHCVKYICVSVLIDSILVIICFENVFFPVRIFVAVFVVVITVGGRDWSFYEFQILACFNPSRLQNINWNKHFGKNFVLIIHQPLLHIHILLWCSVPKNAIFKECMKSFLE